MSHRYQSCLFNAAFSSTLFNSIYMCESLLQDIRSDMEAGHGGAGRLDAIRGPIRHQDTQGLVEDI